MTLNEKESDAYGKTGMFLTLFNRTINGDHIRGFVAGVVITLLVLAPLLP